MNGMHRQRGVTLIELVIVTIIVGILAAIAIPSYRSYVLRSQRSDAKDAVLALATQQEKHYLQCNRYAAAIAGLGDEQEWLVPARDESRRGPCLGLFGDRDSDRRTAPVSGYRLPVIQRDAGGRTLGA